MIAVARTADVVVMMLDATKGDVQRFVSLESLDGVSGTHKCLFRILIQTYSLFVFLFVFRALLEKELESVGIRLNRTKPNIYFKVQCVYLSFFCLTVGITEIRRL